MQITDPKRLTAMLNAMEVERNEAMNARVHAMADVMLLRETLAEAQKSILAKDKEIEALKGAPGDGADAAKHAASGANGSAQPQA